MSICDPSIGLPVRTRRQWADTVVALPDMADDFAVLPCADPFDGDSGGPLTSPSPAAPASGGCSPRGARGPGDGAPVPDGPGVDPAGVGGERPRLAGVSVASGEPAHVESVPDPGTQGHTTISRGLTRQPPHPSSDQARKAP